MTSENTLIRAVPCTTCGAQLLWTQNAWHAGGQASAAYVCRNGHVVDPAETRQCPACGVHDTEVTSTGLDRSSTAAFGAARSSRFLARRRGTAATGSTAIGVTMFKTFQIPLSWGELIRRTVREAQADDCLGLAAQLAYYFLLGAGARARVPGRAREPVSAESAPADDDRPVGIRARGRRRHRARAAGERRRRTANWPAHVRPRHGPVEQFGCRGQHRGRAEPGV